MMVYKCDRCGKMIERPIGEKPYKKVIDFGRSLYDDPTDGGTVEQIDVCDTCYDSFLSWKVMYHNERLDRKEET